MQREGQSLPKRVRGSFPEEETSDLSLKSWVNVCQGNKRKKVLCHVRWVATDCEWGSQGNGRRYCWKDRQGLAREGTYVKGLYFFLPGGDGQILKSFKHKNNQSNTFFRKITLATIGEGVSTTQKQRGHFETMCKITMMKFMINADINVDTCVSFAIYLPLLWVLQTLSILKVQRLEQNDEGRLYGKGR